MREIAFWFSRSMCKEDIFNQQKTAKQKTSVTDYTTVAMHGTLDYLHTLLLIQFNLRVSSLYIHSGYTVQ